MTGPLSAPVLAFRNLQGILAKGEAQRHHILTHLSDLL